MSTPEFAAAVKQEEEYLRKALPTPEDVPGCMALLDSFMMCHGTRPLFRPPPAASHPHMVSCSDQRTGEVPVQVRPDVGVRAEAGRLQVLHGEQVDAPGGAEGGVDSAQGGVVGAQTRVEK